MIKINRINNENRNSRKLKHLLMVISAAAIACALSVSPAFSTVSFAASETLADNTLEYAEIPELIHEYNPTVKNNAYQLKQFKRDYGKTNDSLRQAYQDLADELLNAVDYSGGDPSLDPTYGMRVAASISNENYASQLQSQADAAVEDYDIYKLSYEMAEKQLAQSAQTNMITYYTSQLAAEGAAINADLASAALNVAQAKQKVGMATTADVLSAQEKLLSAQKSVTESGSNVQSVKKKLQIMCGWTYSSEPELGTLPEPDFGRIDAIDLDADIQKAIENNYTLKINQRKYDNAVYDDTKDSLKTTMDANKQNISAAVKTAYVNVTAARDAYTYAGANLALQNSTLAQINSKYAAGNASQYELKSQQALARNAQIALEQARYQVLMALMNYDYAVEGLATAG